VFKELKLLNLYQCQFLGCSTLTSSKTTIKRHCNKEYKDALLNPYIVIKEYSLEVNKFFFKIQSESLNPLSYSLPIEPSSSNPRPSLPNTTTKEAFLASISRKQ